MGVYAIINTLTKQSQNKLIEQMIVQVNEAVTKLFSKINLQEIDEIYTNLFSKQDNKYQQIITYHDLFLKYGELITIPGMEIIFSVEMLPPSLKGGRVNKASDIFQNLELYIIGISKRM